MEKRYQVFISSTFVDLEEERKAIIETIINLDCFPAVMEMFPADDREQFEYIKTIIDDSDYYILIISGRYGSVAEDGKSYTEKEFDYAIEKGIPVLVFVKRDIGSIQISKTDDDPVKKEKLEKFRKRAMNRRMAKYWDDYKDLRYEVNSSLNRAFKTNPRTGWIKGNIHNSDKLLIQINNLREENLKFQHELEKFHKSSTINELACGEDETIIVYNEVDNFDVTIGKQRSITWNEIFYNIGIEILEEGSISHDRFEQIMHELIKGRSNNVVIEKNSLRKVKIQLISLGYIEEGLDDLWGIDKVYRLTERGKKEIYDYLVEKK
ncbi:DUF4062 domain-containing protein [Clostridium sp. UBA3887]|uniref:DUF4062 domain-containing protein n=1 Tax=Clostridium sp. UBA3887 TaxID=1946356 RepID=UPI003216F029